jgi:hypothetical protein
MEDGGEVLGPVEELGIAVFYKAKSNDKAQRKRSPGGEFYPIKHSVHS